MIDTNMKEITLRIADSKLSFFMELVKQLGVEVVEDTPIPQWQKDQVRQSIQEIEDGTAELTEWDAIKKDIFEKYNVK
jgi:hypothetical protein